MAERLWSEVCCQARRSRIFIMNSEVKGGEATGEARGNRTGRLKRSLAYGPRVFHNLLFFLEHNLGQPKVV
jgi:hypothetical protein